MTVPQIKFDEDGLVPAIVQDADTGEVLMLAYMNEQALDRTLSDGLATFFSRSRQQLWRKGESSGHLQHVVEVRVDCDLDAILLRVKQDVAACHEGYRTCFYRRMENGSLRIVEEKVFDPAATYGKKGA
jgi:phosphoribosyl-AMP cyclohydrolase